MKMMKKRNFKYLLVLLFIVIALTISGCTADTTIDVTYSSGLRSDKIADGDSLTVAQFADNTRETGIAGAKNRAGNVGMTYTSTTPIGELVRNTLAEQLEKRGFEVDTMGLWDLNPENINQIKTDLVAGGEIKAFWAENRPGSGQYRIGGTGFGEVSLYIVVVKPDTGEQVWIGEITGGTTQQNLIGSPELEEMLNKAFSEAIDNLLTSSDFIEAITNN